MFLLVRVTLFAVLSVLTDGVDKDVVNGIEPISSALQCFHGYSNEILYDTMSVFGLTKRFADIGQTFFPNLTDFAQSMMMLNNQSTENDTDDSTIISELDKIKMSFETIKWFIKDLLLSKIENNMVKEKFKSSFQDNIDQVKNVFNEFVDLPNVDNKDLLRHECNTTNGLKDVLTDLHIEIVNRDGNNGTSKQILDEGVSLANNLSQRNYILLHKS